MPLHPLTHRSADRLFWRQEWARHWPVWVNGLALWTWLFMVPGPTTEESEVLRWSIVWTGVLALVLAGEDLRRGVDPLARTLALTPRRRWQLRALTVVTGGGLFYLLGWIASSERWAWHVWSQVASGPFLGNLRPAPSPFQPWQGFGVVALTGICTCLMAAHTRNRFAAMLAVLGLTMTAYAFGGTEPSVTDFTPWRELARLPRTSPATAAAIIGSVAWGGAAAFLWSGSSHAGRRPPLPTTGSTSPTLAVCVAMVGIGILCVWIYRFTGIWSLYGYLALTGLIPAFSKAWLIWATLELGLFGFWWWERWKSHASPSPSLRSTPRKPWLGPVVAGMAVVHILSHPVGSFLQMSHKLRQPWPNPLTEVTVATTQSWKHAHAHPEYDPPATAFDVVVWSHYPGRQHEPLSVQTGVIPIPRELKDITTTNLTLARDGSRVGMTTVELTLRWGATAMSGSMQIDKATGKRHWEQRITQARLLLNPRLAQGKRYLTGVSSQGYIADGQHGSSFLSPTLRSLNGSLRTPGSINYSVALIPQSPGVPAVSRPFHDAVHIEDRTPLDLDPVYFNQGLWGFDSLLARNGSLSLPSLIIPGFVFAGLLLLSSRFGSLYLLAAASLFLLACSGADRHRIRKELAISHTDSYPQHQRDFARALAALSYFHSAR